jgi:hypothetical protein
MAKAPANGNGTTKKSCQMKVSGYTKGTVKFVEIDSKGADTLDLLGSLYLRKSAVGELPEGTLITLTVEYPTI